MAHIREGVVVSIEIDRSENTFTLHTDHTTYQMKVGHYGHLLHLYYGRRMSGDASFLISRADRGVCLTPHDAGFDRTYSLDVFPQEFPYQGSGDMRSPCLIVADDQGTYDCDLRFVDAEVEEGKYALKGLPAVYTEAGDDAQTLVVRLKDERLGLTVKLLYGVMPHLDVICRSVEIENVGQKRVVLEKVQSACLDFVAGDFDLITFEGRHAMERTFERRRVDHLSYVAQSRRGASSHTINPLVILTDANCTEEAGRCWAMEFAFSGGFKAEVARDAYQQTRMQMGEDDELFSYPLGSGESFVAPEVIMTYSSSGLSQLSHNLHRCVRDRVCRGYWRDRARPVLINSWEAFYFDFDGDRIVEFAKRAASVGIDLMVMDDGWFSTRSDDHRALGDWWVNEDKLKGTLSDLITRVNDVGMDFGIWMEPEMVSEDSDLYRTHPDWALTIPGKPPLLGRSQLVLDLSRQEVADYVFDAIANVLDQGPIAYLKWDFNRMIADVFSRAATDQGKVLHDYVLGLYSVLERLHVRYPELLIEGCASGGGRFDAGMLYYTPQIWTSDNTDAIDRLSIQYGTSFGYPASAMGAHVSTVPNEQTGRMCPLDTRAIVAETGAFGYELDLAKLSQEELDAVKEQVVWHKRVSDLVAHGRYERLTNPLEDPVAAWAEVSGDRGQVLVSAVITKTCAYNEAHYVRLRGLQTGRAYRDVVSGDVYPADVLMDVGLQLPMEVGTYRGYAYLLERL